MSNRTMEILVKMFSMGESWGWRPSGKNPCRFGRRYKVERRHERFLTPEELYRLGRALDAAPAERLASTHAAAAIRLLVLTGCRRNEILGLRWEDLDFEAEEIRLEDSKTGARVVPLPPSAAKVLRGLSPVDGNPWVFPGRKKGAGQRNINESLGPYPQARGTRRGTPSRPQAQLCVACAGAGGGSVHDRGVAGPPEGVDDCAIRSPRAGLCTGIDGEGGGEHRGGHPAGVVKGNGRWRG